MPIQHTSMSNATYKSIGHQNHRNVIPLGAINACRDVLKSKYRVSSLVQVMIERYSRVYTRVVCKQQSTKIAMSLV